MDARIYICVSSVGGGGGGGLYVCVCEGTDVDVFG